MERAMGIEAIGRMMSGAARIFLDITTAGSLGDGFVSLSRDQFIRLAADVFDEAHKSRSATRPAGE